MAPPSPSSDAAPGGAGEAAYVPPESLTAPVVTGLKWKLLSQVLREGTRLAIGILLARLLTPAEWGVASIALALAALLTMLADLGLPVALVQRARITEADRSTMFWTSTAIGVSATLVGIAVSPLVADVFDEPQLQSLFAVLCLGFTIVSLEKVPGSLLARELQFRALEVRQIIATMSGAAVALGLALAGTGAWAIIGNSLATTTVSCVLLWYVTPWRPRLTFSRDSFRSLTGFGTTLLGSQLLTYVQQNADRLLIGRYLGAGPVGSYAFAYQLMFTPIVNVAYPLQMVLFPVFATIQHDAERLKAGWLRGRRLAVALMAPAFLILLVVAPDLVPLLFGSKWDDSVRVLQLLCFAGIGYSLTIENSVLLLVRDRVGTLFRLSLLVTVVVLGGVIIGLHWGIVGVASGLAIAQWSLFLPTTWVTTRAGSISFADTLRATLAALPFAALGAAAALAVRLALLEVGASSILRILASALTLLVVYGALVYVGSAPIRREMIAASRRIKLWRSARSGKTPHSRTA
jgi:O-antigen/teichoic acid export membrane protein